MTELLDNQQSFRARILAIHDTLSVASKNEDEEAYDAVMDEIDETFREISRYVTDRRQEAYKSGYVSGALRYATVDQKYTVLSSHVS